MKIAVADKPPDWSHELKFCLRCHLLKNTVWNLVDKEKPLSVDKLLYDFIFDINTRDHWFIDKMIKTFNVVCVLLLFEKTVKIKKLTKLYWYQTFFWEVFYIEMVHTLYGNAFVYYSETFIVSNRFDEGERGKIILSKNELI